MVRMVTTAVHSYRGHRLHPGEEYDCEPGHVGPFEKLGWAKRKEGEKPREYETRQMTSRRRSRA